MATMSRLRRICFPSLALLAACSHPPASERVIHEERALAKANAAWAALYTRRGEEMFSPQNIRRFAPYTATLENGVWIVRGTVTSGLQEPTPTARVRAHDGVTTVPLD
jgi:hypothetical protein